MKYILLTLLLYTQLFALHVEYTQEELEWIEKHPNIDYVGDPDWLPFEAYDKNGKYIGIVSDLLHYIEKHSPLKFNIIKTSTYTQSLKVMANKKAMMISQSKDSNANTDLLFTNIYYENPIAIYMSKSKHYVADLYDISDLKIAVDKTLPFYKKLKEKYHKIEFINVSSIKEGLDGVAYGKYDAFVNTLAQTSYIIAKQQLNNVHIVGRTPFYTKLGFGVQKEHKILLDIMNKTLNNIGEDVVHNILSKWIKQKYVEKTDYTYFFIALGVFSIISLMGLFFYFKLKKETLAKLEAQNKMLEQQSKMAAMGEMMDAVAHQWKQPLNALVMYADILKDDFDAGEVDKNYIEAMLKDVNIQIEHMTTTLDEFRNFFRPKHDISDFNLKKLINSVLFLVKDEFMKNSISLHVEVDEDILLRGNENEFKHLILNIINNAKDAFNDKDIKGRDIHISATRINDTVSIEILDNAGGVPLHVIDKVFEANITTKATGKGTGIGLYMSKQIVEKMGGKISVKNVGNGACFYIDLEAY
jgi:signal transduction histidine kinase